MSTSDRVMEKMVAAKALFVKDLETAVVKATKRNSKAPKWNHVSVVLNATWRRDISIADIGRLLEMRLHDSSWSVVFKALIVTHILMDQGSGERLIAFLATQPSMLNLAGFRDASGTRIEQAKNIQRYAAYLEEKVHIYRETKRDYCRPSSPSKASPDSYGSMTRDAHLPTDVARAMRTAPVTESLLRELGVVARQLHVLLKAQFAASEIDNEVTLAAFKLLLRDLMRLYHVLNEGIINVLQHIGDVPVPVAKLGIAVFRQLIGLTKGVDMFLATARAFPPGVLQISIPEFKHIPDIADTLEAELMKAAAAGDGTLGRRLSVAQHHDAAPPSTSQAPPVPSPQTRNAALQNTRSPSPAPANPATTPATKPAALIDFFDAIEDNANQFSSAMHQPNASMFDPFAAGPFVATNPTGPSASTYSTSSAPSGPFATPFGGTASSAFDPFAAPAPAVPTNATGPAFNPFAAAATVSANPFPQHAPALGAMGGSGLFESAPVMRNTPSPAPAASAHAFTPFDAIINPPAGGGVSPARAATMPVTAAATGNPFDAFGSVGTSVTGAPFGGVGTSTMGAPFGGVGTSATGTPFGGIAPATTGSPFDAAPFGSSSTPFGTVPTTATGSPFGASQGTPFGTQATGPPFGAQATGSTFGAQPTGTSSAFSSPFAARTASPAPARSASPFAAAQSAAPVPSTNGGANYVAVADPFGAFDPFANKPTAAPAAGTNATGNPFAVQQQQQPVQQLQPPFFF
ncbi:hypothetical protein AMAG_12963 [Allomyces macrogynus ATCC 38327]|uniref:ENTH domain-containing protein n=1 Tax=Allomyces macrogynus (strain ATCC 38327) TaxID=578462 RepID=A0A0L0T0W8_ALLM3|nr:hypothetical protein AMAG_12963 [Allomyces macrogynus ATCC 38327]|eukprot:KNE68295.1 hypothetical protein AMAG_12963 [Allomyces macrogynus ATCC 38327]